MRYLGGEYQAVVKDAADARVCLAFPDVYDIGMSHPGTKIIYSLLNRDPRIACERAFAPWLDMEAELRERGLPLVSLETQRPLCEFDVVGPCFMMSWIARSCSSVTASSANAS